MSQLPSDSSAELNMEQKKGGSKHDLVWNHTHHYERLNSPQTSQINFTNMQQLTTIKSQWIQKWSQIGKLTGWINYPCRTRENDSHKQIKNKKNKKREMQQRLPRLPCSSSSSLQMMLYIVSRAYPRISESALQNKVRMTMLHSIIIQ